MTRVHSHWFRGEVFTITHFAYESNALTVTLKRTGYAHYLGTIHGLIKDSEACRVLYTAAVLRTQDNFCLFGQMNLDTAYPGRLQGVGAACPMQIVMETA